MAKTYTIQDFFKQFPDDDACLDHLMAIRYGNPLDCPKCDKHGRFSRISGQPAYQCAWCGHHIHPMAGTPFENTRTPLQSWFYVMYLFTTTRHGVPAKEVQRQLSVTYKTAWRMCHEIRKYMAKVDSDDGLSGHVEADETYVGGKPHHKGTSRGGRSADGKTIVFGIVERDGELITRVVPNASRKTIEPHIFEFVPKRTVMSTDEWVAYDNLRKMGYVHGRVNHGRDEWVNGDTHTNTIEGF